MSFLKTILSSLFEALFPIIKDAINEPDKAIDADRDTALRDRLHDSVRINTSSVRRGRIGSKDWTQR